MFIVYCSDQLDGIAAAAIVFRYAKLKNTDCRLGGTLGYGHLAESFRAMQAHKGALFFILDIYPDRVAEFEFHLRNICAENRIAYWSSHHAYDSPLFDTLKKYVHTVDFGGALKNSMHSGLKPMSCSADLAARSLLPHDKVAHQLAAIARDQEFWLRQDEQSQKLADVIQAGYDKKELVELLSKGVYWSAKLERVHQDYLLKKKYALEELKTHMIVKQYLDQYFGFSIASNSLRSADACEHMLETHTGLNVAIAVYRDGRISFRRRNSCKIDLTKLAKYFNGGGHPYAAGGRLDTNNVTFDNFGKIVFEIDQKLKLHFLK